MPDLLNNLNKRFNLLYFGICSICFLIVLFRSLYVPIAHDEVATFYYYIQSGSFIPFQSHIDANGHFLNSLLSYVSYKMFGSSEFALRLPGLMAFLILCYAVYRLNNSVKSVYSKLIFTSSFILSFNLINFYSLCRGYGLTISFCLTGLFFLFEYISSSKIKNLILSFICLQLALSAGLTLVFLLLLCGAIAVFFLFSYKQLFKPVSILMLAGYFGLIFFWVKYAFYLQENGALYYGGGDSYWTVTFKSLIDTVLINNLILYEIVIAVFIAIAVIWLIRIFKNKFSFLLNSRFVLSFLLLSVLIITFYLLKQVLNVNYPEDRTGLFFYILFILSVGYLADENEMKLSAVYLGIPCFFLIHLAFNLNFRKHAWGFYETMPKRFYQTLVNEQKNSKEPIVVGGHRVLELFFSYYNYRSETKLSHMLPPEQMHMNCDFYITWKKDEPYYKNFYDELDYDNNWNMVLLKRKEKVKRELVIENKTTVILNGANEFNTLFERTDTVFQGNEPILAEINFDIDEVPEPFNAWLVMQIDSAGGPQKYFRRTPLNWVNLKWNGTKNFTTCIQTDNLPEGHNRLVLFLWNLDKKEIKMRINSFKLYHLNAKGITLASKAL